MKTIIDDGIVVDWIAYRLPTIDDANCNKFVSVFIESTEPGKPDLVVNRLWNKVIKGETWANKVGIFTHEDVASPKACQAHAVALQAHAVALQAEKEKQERFRTLNDGDTTVVQIDTTRIQKVNHGMGSLEALHEAIGAVIANIPPAYRESATVSLGEYSVDAYYHRPCTEAELEDKARDKKACEDFARKKDIEKLMVLMMKYPDIRPKKEK